MSAPRPTLGLAPLGFLELEPPELVSVAAAAGFTGVTLRLRSAVPGGVEHPVPAGSRLAQRTLERVAATGVAVDHVELVSLGRDTDDDAVRRLVDDGAALGARRVVATGDDLDLRLVADRLAAVCELASEARLVVDLEFMPFRPVATLGQALEVVALTGRPDAHVLVDALHLARSGGVPADVAAARPELLGACHLSDAPTVPPPPDHLAEEARAARLLPGAGSLPLPALVAALPPATAFVAEVPLGGREAGLSPVERARLVHRATAPLLAGRGPA